MNKKLIFGFVFALLLIGIAIGATSKTFDKEINLNATQNAILEEKGFNNIKVGTTYCDVDNCKVNLYKKDVINTEVSFPRYYINENNQTVAFTDDEIKAGINEAIERRLKGIADYYIGKETSTITPKFTDGGTITIKPKAGGIAE